MKYKFSLHNYATPKVDAATEVCRLENGYIESGASVSYISEDISATCT